MNCLLKTFLLIVVIFLLIYVKAHGTRFIGNRAYENLKEINDFGPKFAASFASEVLTVNYLLAKLNAIKSEANASQQVMISHQIVDGYNFNSDIYRNIQNVVARLEGTRPDALLVNCHFDSVVGSPGASDDAANCCVMIEILKILARQNLRTKNSIIFLFNGAEEIGRN